MRTEYAWANCFDADMVPLDSCMGYEYDLCIFILPKKDRCFDNICKTYKDKYSTSKVGVMQEGPIDYFYNFPAEDQLYFLSCLSKVDFLLTHNEDDKTYLENLFPNSLVRVMSSL